MQFCIVGAGPRGLVALERLIAEAGQLGADDALKITLFESSDYPGCGPNYAPDQPLCNQLNVPLRDIPIPRRSPVHGELSYSAFPSFQQWYKAREPVNDSVADVFPPRAEIGNYLQARFKSIVEANKASVELICDEVVAICEQDGQWHLHTKESTQPYRFDEALLAVGHQPADSDSNLERWKEQTSGSDLCTLHLEPYPNQLFVESKKIDKTSVVALRGMGLSMIDIVKSLTVGRGGEYLVTDRSNLKMQYRPCGREPGCIVPFSLDGLPMAPKPVSSAIDSRFDVSDDAIQTLKTLLAADESNFSGNALRDLMIRQASAIAGSVYVKQGDYFSTSITKIAMDSHTVGKLAQRWLQDEDFDHQSIIDSSQPVHLIMQQFLAMATGNMMPSLDFCIGQVWRKLQPCFYECLSFRQFKPEVIESAMALDQRLKRYAFGPPVEATAMLLALYENGLLLFKIADDPDIHLSSKGWELRDDDDCIVANVMINTVLDEAQLSAMNSDLMIQLNSDGYTEAVHSKLGAKALQDGRLIQSRETETGLAASGRLVMGSVFEADALLCCFGDDMTLWSREALARQMNQVVVS